jgi:hypothetical protein
LATEKQVNGIQFIQFYLYSRQSQKTRHSETGLTPSEHKIAVYSSSILRESKSTKPSDFSSMGVVSDSDTRFEISKSISDSLCTHGLGYFVSLLVSRRRFRPAESQLYQTRA